MKAHILILAFSLVTFISSCNHTDNKSEGGASKTQSDNQSLKILANLNTVTGVDEKQVRKDSSYYVISDYFEIGLYPINGKYYVAEDIIEKPTSIENFKSSSVYISDEKNKMIRFKTPTEFLNYVSERGYEMESQLQQQDHVAYTFKKKVAAN